jgi:hypothetical protein
MNNCENLNIGLNKLYNLEKGVLAQGSSENYFYENIADYGPSGGSPNANRNGFVIENGSNNFCNNFSDNHSEHGFYFAGICFTTDFKCSNINNDATGLYLWADNTDPNFSTHPTTIIGEQDQLNNTWNGSGAYHDEGFFLDYIDQSRFTQKNIPAFNTTYTLNTGLPTDWFVQQNDTPLDCGTCRSPTPLLGTGGGSEGGGIRETERIVAGNGFGNDVYQWMAAQRLFQRIASKEALKQDPTLDQFFTNQSSSLLGDLAGIQHSISEITQGSDFSQKEFGKLSEKINSLGDAISIWLDAPDGAERTKRLAQLNAELDWAIRSMNGYEKYAQDQRIAYSDDIVLKMKSLEAKYVYEQNELMVNNLLLTYRLWSEGLTDVPVAVWAEIKSIADQCPHTGGWPVYWARSLYRQHAPMVTWEVLAGCSPTVERRASTYENNNKVEIYPNPTQSELTVLLQRVPNASLQLWDIHGKLLLERTLLEGKNSVDLQQPNGLYLYRVQLQDGTIETGKIVIIH